MKYVEKVRKYFNRPEKSVFSYSELKALGIPEKYIKVLMYNMIKRNEVYRVRKGWYTFHKDPLVFIFALPPNTAYYGLGFAAYLYDVWDQVSNPEILTYVAPRKIRSGAHFFLNTPIIVRRISKKMFFGYRLLKHDNWYIPVSSPEKTLIDMVYYNYPFLDEILPGLTSIIDLNILHKMLTSIRSLRKKVAIYLKRYIQSY